VSSLHKLRNDVAASRSTGTTEGLLRSQEALQKWMDKCAGNAGEFDRTAVSGLWNRVGEGWASRAEYDKAAPAFANALSLLRKLPHTEDLLVSMRGLAESEWKLDRRQEGSALAREQLDIARSMRDDSLPTALYLIDALEFAGRFAGMDGNSAESARLANEAQALRESIDKQPTDNAVPALTAP
jgi:hypothetical protein